MHHTSQSIQYQYHQVIYTISKHIKCMHTRKQIINYVLLKYLITIGIHSTIFYTYRSAQNLKDSKYFENYTIYTML